MDWIEKAAKEIADGTTYTNDFGDAYSTMEEDNIAAIIKRHYDEAHTGQCKPKTEIKEVE